MLSITLAILALYVLEIMKMAAQPRVAYVCWVISICLAIAAAFFGLAADRRERITNGG